MVSPAARARLQAANDLVLKLLGENLPPHEVIDEMIEQLGAQTRYRSGTQQLVCAGVTGSGTCGTSPILLGSWRRAAMKRLLASDAKADDQRVTIYSGGQFGDPDITHVSVADLRKRFGRRS